MATAILTAQRLTAASIKLLLIDFAVDKSKLKKLPELCNIFSDIFVFVKSGNRYLLCLIKRKSAELFLRIFSDRSDQKATAVINDLKNHIKIGSEEYINCCTCTLKRDVSDILCLINF